MKLEEESLKNIGIGKVSDKDGGIIMLTSSIMQKTLDSEQKVTVLIKWTLDNGINESNE